MPLSLPRWALLDDEEIAALLTDLRARRNLAAPAEGARPSDLSSTVRKLWASLPGPWRQRVLGRP